MDSSTKPSRRLPGLDALRGAVMILMALDHVRDFFHVGAMSFSPTDLTKTSPILFLTRWITHFCLPVFVFISGAGAFLWYRQNNHTLRQLSRFLWTRGLWFIFLELTVMQFAYNFNVSSGFPVILLILWIFGICMTLLAALIYLPMPWLLTFSAAGIALHNCLDRVNVAGSAAPLWRVIHRPGLVTLLGHSILVTYTLLPWIAVMSAGFCFGRVFYCEAHERQRIMRRMGCSLIVAFIALRAINLYGDPLPWSPQKSAVFTVLSFLNCTKYPASLDFLFMTLGLALLVLAYLDRHSFSVKNPLIVFGRVPMFYFILHFYLIHALAVMMAWLRYGNPAVSFMFNPLPSVGGPRQLFPSNFGYSLGAAYLIWILVVVSLYPICKWFANVKARHRSWWLSYL
jgi:uncharacterized membrane protein